MSGNLDRAMKALLVVGGINWLTVAAGKFDMVAALTGRRFGTPNVGTRVVYGLVGGSALYTLSRWIGDARSAGGSADGRRVRDAMTPDPTSVSSSTTVADAARLLGAEDVGSLPVVDGDRLVGVLTDRDIVLRVVREGRDPAATTVADVATRELETARPEQPLDEALRLMARRQVRRLPVLDGGRLVGILAQADVADDAPAHRTGEMVEQISR
jgi:CBS domain-containing protein